jgi:ribosome-associated protein
MSMHTSIVNSSILMPELVFTTSRSSGPGGQNVNKVNSKVTLRFAVAESAILSDEQKAILLVKLATRLTNDGVLLLTSQEKRSQADNKEEVLVKLDKLLKKALTPSKPRRKTKPTKASKIERVKEKKKRGEKKEWRKRLDH